MGPETIIERFDQLTDELLDALADLDDWGHSGLRPDQYNHDVVADEVMLEPLLADGFRVLSEESGLTGDGEITVVVDPVDGSTNASLGLPWFAASLCAVDADGPLASVVTNLATGDRFAAIRGAGAELDEGAGAMRAPRPLAESIVCVSGNPPDDAGWAQFRQYGAGALDLCSVAVGRFDGFVELGSHHGCWDYLGALLVLTESGAHVADAHGRDLVVLEHAVRRSPVAATSTELLDDLLAIARRY